MRARNIKPGFFENDLLVEMPFEFRLLFIGLWTMADKSGRLEDRPKKIKMCVFPADDVDVNRGLTDLSRHGFIQRYEVDGSKYIQVVNWKKHQKPHHTEKESVIPPLNNGEETVNPHNQDRGNPPDSLIPDSLIPDSLIPDSGAGAQKARTPLSPGQALPEYSMEFEQLWDLYPRKEAKESAWIAFKGAKAAHQYPGNPIVLPVVVQWAESPRWQEEGGKFVPMLANWINGRRWEDKFTGPPRELTPEEKASRDAEEMRRIRAARSLQ